MNMKEAQKQADYYSKITKKCKCGHSVVMPVFVDKKICSYCGNLIFKDKKTEDLYRIREKLNKC